MKNTQIRIFAVLVSLTAFTIQPVTNISTAYAQEHDDEHGEENVVELSAKERDENGIVISSVEERMLANTVSAPGEVTANHYRSSQITSRISAQITGRHVKMGDLVKSGQVLVTLSSVGMAEAQGDLILAHQNWMRSKNLGKEIVSEQKYIEAQVNAQQARAKVLAYGMTEPEVNMLLKSSKASAASGTYNLYAQQNGTVTQDNFIMGQFVEAGQPIMNIINEENVWVEAQLSPAKAAAIDFGADAWIVKDATQVSGKVVQVHHTVDEESRTIAVRAEFDNSSDKFHSGEFVNITVQAGTSSPSIAVPTEAITLLEGANVVFMLEGEELHPVKVEIGRKLGAWTEILSGIHAGDEIVTKQAFFVKSLILKSKMGEGHAH